MKLAPNHPVMRFQRLFEHITPDTELDLDTLYHEEIEFIDPFHRLTARSSLQQYFARLSKRVSWAAFDFEPPVVADGSAVVPWTMRFRSKGYPRTMAIEGVSHLRFDDRIFYHRDYFDVTALIADAIPGLGAVARLLKRLA